MGVEIFFLWGGEVDMFSGGLRNFRGGGGLRNFFGGGVENFFSGGGGLTCFQEG